jgi:hypothetical protein
MAAQRTTFRIAQSIAGAVLVGFGAFVLYDNVAGAVARLSGVLSANGSKALGALPAAALAVSQAVHANGVSHQWLLQGVSPQTLMSSWPLILVLFGTVLSSNAVTDKSKQLQEPATEPVHLCSFRAPYK